MLRPTARLRFEIDRDELNDELTGDLKNCFLNVAPLKITERPEIKDDQPAKNILGLMVILNEPYFSPSSESADAMWEDVLLPWLERKLYKINATVQGYNRTRAESGQPVNFGQFELILGSNVIAVQLPDSSELPGELPELATEVRACANAGCFDRDASFLRVEISRLDLASAEEPEKQPADDDADAPSGFSAVWNIRDGNGAVAQFNAKERIWIDG